MSSIMNDIDDLMARIDEINYKSAGELSSDDIAVLIQYHRHNRARLASGLKPTKPKIDLDAILGDIITKPKVAGPSPFKGKL